MSRESALLAGREMLAKAMQDTCMVRRQTGRMIQSETSGREVREWAPVFVTKCKLSLGGLGSLIPTSKDDPAGGRITTELRMIVYMPVDTPHVQPDDEVVVLEIAPHTDPMLLGFKGRIVAPVGNSWATARRFLTEQQMA